METFSGNNEDADEKLLVTGSIDSFSADSSYGSVEHMLNRTYSDLSISLATSQKAECPYGLRVITSPSQLLAMRNMSISQPRSPRETTFLSLSNVYLPSPRCAIDRTRSRSPSDDINNDDPKMLVKARYSSLLKAVNRPNGDERHAAEESTIDWYQDYSTLAPYIQPFLKQTDDFEILIPGCGTSKLGADIYDAGFPNITNIDISEVAINLMSDLFGEKEEMEFTVMDARKMEYVPDQCFDLIVDKGLFDTFLCNENNLRDVESYLKECYRVLKTGGVLLVISHGGPSRRMQFLQMHLTNMHIEVQSIRKLQVRDLVEQGEAENHYMYVCKKEQS